MQIGLSELLKQDGLSEEFHVSLDAKSFSYWGSEYPIADESRVDLVITHQGKRVILVSGHAKLALHMQCGRCLDEVPVPFELVLEAQLDFNRSMEEEDELPFIRGYDLDVDRLVFDELILNMPINVLCSPDCKGICPRCGKNLNTGNCACDTTELDPRMAKILDIFNATNKEV